jgi:DNA (cytosine-5)-methyltransferase 1
MSNPKLLDLFCGGGGASMGYYQAGFEVVGVDIEPQPKYPFTFIQGDVFQVLPDIYRNFDVIVGSPKCQRYSTITKCGTDKEYEDQIPQLRWKLMFYGRPYVIENVPRAPLIDPTILCGTMFGLNVIRHRAFESSLKLAEPPVHNHVKTVVKHGRRPDRTKHYAAATGHMSDVPFVQESMGISWLGQKGLAQAIPPAYTLWIGKQLMKRFE